MDNQLQLLLQRFKQSGDPQDAVAFSRSVLRVKPPEIPKVYLLMTISFDFCDHYEEILAIFLDLATACKKFCHLFLQEDYLKYHVSDSFKQDHLTDFKDLVNDELYSLAYELTTIYTFVAHEETYTRYEIREKNIDV